MKISMTKGKRRLAYLWFVGAGIIFAIILVQSIGGKYGERLEEAWGWALQTVVPTLSLMLSVFVIETQRKLQEEKWVKKFYYRLCFWFSFIYLFLVLLTIMIQPFVEMANIEWMKQSNIWLGAFQALVGISLGVFFFKDENSENDS